MADATKTGPVYISGQGGPAIITKVRITAGDGQSESTSFKHGGPSGVAPSFVHMVPVTKASDEFPVCLLSVAYDTTDNEVDIVYGSSGDTDETGDVTGAVFDMFCFFFDVA